MARGSVMGQKSARRGVLGCWLALLAAACAPGGWLPAGLAGAVATAPQASPVPVEGTAVNTSAVVAGQSGSWYQVYFTNPVLTSSLSDPTGGIPDQIAAAFDGAHTTIDLAIYQFDLQVLSDALLRAQARGVRLRVVTDSDSLNMDGIVALVKAGVPVMPDQRQAIMHDKFAVIDGAAVWTGSMNYTFNDAYRNDNNVIAIQSPELAQNYTHEFEKLFVSMKFGPHTTVDTPHPIISLGGTKIETYYSPVGAVAAHVNDALTAAHDSLNFLAFGFTRKDFGQILLDQAAAGRDVRGVFEGEQLAAGGDAVWQMLATGGLSANIRQDGNRYNMHDKVFIIDKAVVVTGSYNFSTAAENDNDENVLIIHNPALAAAYFAAWEKIWAQGR